MPIDPNRTETLKEKVMLAYHDDVMVAIKSQTSLKEALAKIWNKYKGTICSHTAHPDSEVTSLLCDIATKLGNELGEKPIHLLMPGVSTESMMDGVLSLDEMDLKEVLKTHVLSESGNYLYPVCALASLQCEVSLDSQQIPNPYFDYNLGPESEAYIPVLALKRMLNHAVHTEAIADAAVQYQSLIKPTNLFGQLQLLIKTLRMNSTAGIGQEEQAGSRAYAGIISFNEYYQTLSEAQRNTIPPKVKYEIEYLLDLSSNKEQNTHGVENLETCINTRQQELASVTKKHEKELIEIGFDDNTQSQMIQNARVAFENCQVQLLQQCRQGTYCGSDKLGLSKQLIDTLSISVSIGSEADFQDFLSLSANDIEMLLKNNIRLISQCVRQISKFEGLVLFSIHAPIPQLKVILKHCMEYLVQPQPKELSGWLEFLDLKRGRIVIKAFEDVFDSFDNLLVVLTQLDSQKQNMVLKEYKAKLLSWNFNSEDLNKLLGLLNEEQCQDLLVTISDKVPHLIKNAQDVSAMFKNMSGEVNEALFEKIKHKIPGIIETNLDLQQVLEHLCPKVYPIVLTMVKAKLPSLIKVSDDVKNLIWAIDDEQRLEMLEFIASELPRVINKLQDLTSLLLILDEEQSCFVLKTVKAMLPSFINEFDDVRKLIWSIDDDQTLDVLKDIASELPRVMNKLQELTSLLVVLDREQSCFVLQTIKDKLPILINSAQDLFKVLNLLNKNKCTILLEAFKEELPNIVKNLDDLLLFSLQKNVNRLSLYQAMKDSIPSFINSTQDLLDLFKNSNKDVRFFVIEAIKAKLPSLMKSKIDVDNISIYLSLEQFVQLFAGLKKHHQELSEKGSYFWKIYWYFNNNNYLAVLEKVKKNITKLINTPEDLNRMLKRMSIEDALEILKKMKDTLLRFIENQSDINKALSHLNKSKRAAFLPLLNQAIVRAGVPEIAPLYLPHKRVIEGNEPGAKRQKGRISRLEMASLQQNTIFIDPREPKLNHDAAKRRRISPS